MSWLRPLLALPLALALAAGCGSDAASTAAARADAAAAAARLAEESIAGGNKLVPVMTRNLYLGADLDRVRAAGDQQAFLLATTTVWGMVKANDFHVRAEALADEIASQRPALVGLQEAYTWRKQTPGDLVLGGTTLATDVVYDDVPELVAALRARHLEYRVAAEVTLFDFEAPVVDPASPIGFSDVRMTDHGVVLARADVQTEDGQGVVYDELFPVSVLGQDLPVKRGFASARVKYRGEWLRFVSTHLEAFDADVRVKQAIQLRDALAGEQLPVVLVGDLNSQPGSEGEAVLAAAGFQDTWAALEDGAPGLTCCFLEALAVPAPPARLETRIDYVLTRGPIQPRDITILGNDEQVSGLWPSDHAGVSAVLRLALPGRSGTGRHP
jgi:endonuclease/exonuclease/phosphatase family metal-dependent hydrolase